MTHKYDRVSKVIKETFGEPSQLLRKFTNMSDHYIKDHADLVRLCYAVLEEFGDKDESQD